MLVEDRDYNVLGLKPHAQEVRYLTTLLKEAGFLSLFPELGFSPTGVENCETCEVVKLSTIDDCLQCFLNLFVGEVVEYPSGTWIMRVTRSCNDDN